MTTLRDIWFDKNKAKHIRRFLQYGEKSIDEIAKEEGKHYNSIRRSIIKGQAFYEKEKSNATQETS